MIKRFLLVSAVFIPLLIIWGCVQNELKLSVSKKHIPSVLDSSLLLATQSDSSGLEATGSCVELIIKKDLTAKSGKNFNTTKNNIIIDKRKDANSHTLPDTYLAYNVAINAIESINCRDYESLSRYVHPEKGILFSPYSFVDYNEHLVFSSEQVGRFAGDNSIYIWGIKDASNIPLELTVDDYFNRYVYDKNYLFVDQIGINIVIRQQGNIQNIKEHLTDLFGGCIIVDFYDQGSGEYEGLDWSSIILVLEKYNGRFNIVAIVHSSYTL